MVYIYTLHLGSFHGTCIGKQIYIYIRHTLSVWVLGLIILVSDLLMKDQRISISAWIGCCSDKHDDSSHQNQGLITMWILLGFNDLLTETRISTYNPFLRKSPQDS